MTLLEIDNQNFTNDLSYGKSEASTKVVEKEEKSTSKGPSGLVIAVKVNKKRLKKSSLAKNALRKTDQHIYVNSKSVRWNQDSIRNCDNRKFQKILKSKELASPGVGLYQAIENKKVQVPKFYKSKNVKKIK